MPKAWVVVTVYKVVSDGNKQSFPFEFLDVNEFRIPAWCYGQLVSHMIIFVVGSYFP